LIFGKEPGFDGIVTIIYECAYFFGRWEHSLYESERLKKESLISQLELLKTRSARIFINSLNALITLVPEDPKLFRTIHPAAFQCIPARAELQ